MALDPEKLAKYWEENPDALAKAIQDNPEAWGITPTTATQTPQLTPEEQFMLNNGVPMEVILAGRDQTVDNSWLTDAGYTPDDLPDFPDNSQYIKDSNNTYAAFNDVKTLEDLINITSGLGPITPATPIADFGNPITPTYTPVADAAIKSAAANDIELVKKGNGERFVVADLGIEDTQEYLDALSKNGLLPELPKGYDGWEVHRKADGRIIISPNEPDPNLASQLFPVIVTTGITAGLGAGAGIVAAPLGPAGAGAVSGAVSSASGQQILTGDIDTNNLLLSTVEGAALGWITDWADRTLKDIEEARKAGEAVENIPISADTVESLKAATDAVEEAEKVGTPITIGSVLDPKTINDLRITYEEANKLPNPFPTNEEIAKEGGQETNVPPETGVNPNPAELEGVYNPDGSINQEALKDYLDSIGVDIDILPGLDLEGDATQGGEDEGKSADTGTEGEGAPSDPDQEGDTGSIPDEIGGGGQDGIVANQIYEAILRAEDPELKDKLIKEYEIYTGEEFDPNNPPDPNQVDSPTQGDEAPTDLPPGYRWVIMDGEWVLVKEDPEDTEEDDGLILGPGARPPGAPGGTGDDTDGVDGGGGDNQGGSGDDNSGTGDTGGGPGSDPDSDSDGGGTVDDGGPGPGPGTGDQGDGPGDGGDGGDDKDKKDDDGDKAIQTLLALLAGGSRRLRIPRETELVEFTDPYDFTSIFRNPEQEARMIRPQESKETEERRRKILYKLGENDTVDTERSWALQELLRSLR